jgi:hypothetical protein
MDLYLIHRFVTRRGQWKTLNVIARSPCDQAVQVSFVALDCFARARNDAERPAENSPRHCEELLRRRNPVLACAADLAAPAAPTRLAIVPCEAMDRRQRNRVNMATVTLPINRRIRLPKELTAIWSASTLPACRLDPTGE